MIFFLDFLSQLDLTLYLYIFQQPCAKMADFKYDTSRTRGPMPAKQKPLRGMLMNSFPRYEKPILIKYAT